MSQSEDLATLVLQRMDDALSTLRRRMTTTGVTSLGATLLDVRRRGQLAGRVHRTGPAVWQARAAAQLVKGTQSYVEPLPDPSEEPPESARSLADDLLAELERAWLDVAATPAARADFVLARALLLRRIADAVPAGERVHVTNENCALLAGLFLLSGLRIAAENGTSGR